LTSGGRWLVGNLLVALGAPIVFGFWIAREVQREYASGARVSTDGDSIGIPIFGFTLIVWSALLCVNVAALLVRRVRTRQG